jgi:hypothetical protein
MAAKTPKDDFEARESDSLSKLARHIAAEMPAHVIIAIAMVAFMFFYGMINSLVYLTGRTLASFTFPLGAVVGATGSVVVTALILRLKYGRR